MAKSAFNPKPIVESLVESALEQVDNLTANNEDFTQKVLHYLEKQQDVDEYLEADYPEQVELDSFNEVIIRSVLDKLLVDVDNITSFREVYGQKKKEHNQYGLFDLTTIIKDFNISDQLLEIMSFRESLLISKITPKNKTEPLGGLCLDVQSAMGSKWEHPSNKLTELNKSLLDACKDVRKKYEKITDSQIREELDEYEQFLTKEMKKEYSKFLVHFSSQFNLDGQNAGSRIIAWVDRELHTLEEKRTEYVTNSEGTVMEKKIYIAIEKKHYQIRVEDTATGTARSFCYSFRRAKNYVGEAANFMLMRYMVLTKYIGTIELAAIYIEGGLCRNIYQSDGPMGGIINNHKMDLHRIYRTLIEECGITHRCCTILASDGRIMKQDWQNCDYILQLNPLSNPKRKKPALVIHFTEAWKYDMQLLSRYLDQKTQATMEMRSYLEDHKDVVKLVSDFVQNILTIKPENIVDFSRQYFTSYAPYLLPRCEYFEQINGPIPGREGTDGI